MQDAVCMPQNLWSILFFCTLHTRRSLRRLNIEVLFSERAKLIFLFSACWCYADGDSLLRGKTIVTELRFVMCPFLCSCHLFCMVFCQSVQRNSSSVLALLGCVFVGVTVLWWRKLFSVAEWEKEVAIGVWAAGVQSTTSVWLVFVL